MKETTAKMLLCLVAGWLAFGCGLEVEPPPEESTAAPESSAVRVALVVEDGATGDPADRYCVEVEPSEDEAPDGRSLLDAAGVEHTAQYFRDQQSWALCSVGAAGCEFPTKGCFCDSSYWSAWRLEDGQWVSFNRGLSHWGIEDGQVWGLRWGDGATPPGAVTFGAVCPTGT